MKKQHLLISAAFMVVTAAALFTACSKSTSAGSTTTPGTQNVSLFMTDGPGAYLSVKLDIKSVLVLIDTSSNTRKHDGDDWDFMGRQTQKPDSSLIWDSLHITAGVYDLLQLRNGIDTLLGQANIKAGSIRLIKISLGTRDSVMTSDSITHAIQIPAGFPPYILIKLRGDEWEHYASNSYRLWIDFNVSKSIIQFNGAFYLSPFITAFIVNQTGTISGTLAPRDAWPEMVQVMSSSDTAYALPNRDGFFKIRGLKDGTYKATFSASNGYKDTTVNNIVITNAGTVSVGTITLHK